MNDYVFMREERLATLQVDAIALSSFYFNSLLTQSYNDTLKAFFYPKPQIKYSLDHLYEIRSSSIIVD